MASKSFTYSDFYCLKCTNKITLPRKGSRQREKNHLKVIHCFHCKTSVNHYEVRDCDIEFNLEALKGQIQSGLFDDKKEMLK
jgi:hypothetical protein